MRTQGLAAAGLVAVLVLTASGATAGESSRGGRAAAEARQLLHTAGVKGGLVVHVGCGDGRLTAALRAGDAFLVQGLDRDEEDVRAARRHIKASGLYGEVSVRHWTGYRLPYVTNLVNLVVCEDIEAVSRDEIMRVLAPRGVLCTRKGGRWTKTVKPWPEEIDEWTHYLHGPDNNAVSQDERVGPPRHLQWRAGPLWCRSHDHLSSVSAVVSARGRVFSIMDLGSVASVAFPPRWFLVARDAFSGVKLWQKRISPWENRFRGFRSGPPHLARRLVAVGDRVYVTPGYGKPVVALHAATGALLETYEGTEGTEEILYEDGTLYVVIGDPGGILAARRARRRGEDEPEVGKSIMAVRADTGRMLWKRTEAEAGYVMPTTLAVSDERVFYEDTENVVCLDAGSGEELWRASRPVTRSRPTWLAPTLVVRDGVVLSADRDASSVQGAGPIGPTERIKWRVSSKEPYRVKTVPVGKLFAFDARTGERVWSCAAAEGFTSPPDVLVSRGLVWTGMLVRGSGPGITRGRDLFTGEVKFRRPPDQEFFSVTGHHRCYRNKATSRYLVMGRLGIELIDLDSGEGIADHWVRGACQYGVMPGNGLIYVPPHSCACFIKSKLKGFNALAAETRRLPIPEAGPAARVRGPAYGRVESDDRKGDGDWPTYRHDAARSGRAECAVPDRLAELWKTSLPGRLSNPVVADGRVLVASVDASTVHALDARTGRRLWEFTAGGRVDGPPTVHEGRVIFGSADGRVYCLRARDGQLVWRFRAAPDERQIVNMDRLESAWPVHGSVLVQDGVAYFAAGRSSYLDGGMFLCGLDAETGEEVFRRRLYYRDPETGLEPQEPVRGVSMPGALPDVLSSDGRSIFMRHKRFNLEGIEQEQNVPHLYSSVGFLDDEWWHRTYWIIGTQTGSGFGGWPRPGNSVPSGRLLVRDGSLVYGFGRNAYRAHGQGGGSHPGVGGIHYELFATRMERGRHVRRWARRLPFWVRAMVLARNDTLFVAGPPVAEYLSTREVKGAEVADDAHDGKLGPWYGEYFLSLRRPEEALDAYQGKKGAGLWAVSASSGERLAAYELDSPPVFDAMVAAGGRLYVCTENGKVVCMGEE